MESHTIKPIRKFKCGIEQIEYTLPIGNQLHPLIFKNLITGLDLIVKIHFICQTGTSATYNAYPYKIILPLLSSSSNCSTRALAFSLIKIPFIMVPVSIPLNSNAKLGFPALK